MAKLTVNLPNLPKDTEVEIPPHGMFKNRHIYEVEVLDEDLVLGKELDHKTVLDWPLAKIREQRAKGKEEPESTPLVGAELTSAPSEMASPGVEAETDNKDGA